MEFTDEDFDRIKKRLNQRIVEQYNPSKLESKILQIIKIYSATYYKGMGYKITFKYRTYQGFCYQKYWKPYFVTLGQKGKVRRVIECNTFEVPNLTRTLNKLFRFCPKWEVSLCVPEQIRILKTSHRDMLRIKHLPQILQDYGIKLVKCPYHYPIDEKKHIAYRF